MAPQLHETMGLEVSQGVGEGLWHGILEPKPKDLIIFG